MITVFRVEENEQVRDARRHAAGEAGWLLFHVLLAAGTAYAGWRGVAGVWPPVWWLLAGVIAGDALRLCGSVWWSVRDARLMARSRAFRLLVRELDEAGQRARTVYRPARRAEIEQTRATRRGRRGPRAAR